MDPPAFESLSFFWNDRIPMLGHCLTMLRSPSAGLESCSTVGLLALADYVMNDDIAPIGIG